MDEFTCAHVSVGVCLWMTHITARHFSRHQSSNFSVCWHFGSCLVSVQFCMRSTGRTTNLSPWCSPWTRLCRTWYRQSSNLEEITSWSKWTPREVGKQRKHILCLKILCVTVNVWKTTEPSSSVRSSFDPHRKSSAEAGCHCGLHSAGTQRETVHLHEQPSGSAGEDCGALQVRRILTIIEAVFTVFLPLFLPPDASEGAAGSRARNDRRPGTDEL